MPEMDDDVAEYEAARRGEDPTEVDSELQRAIDKMEKGVAVEEIKAGHVIDPSTGVDGIYDVFIEDGAIAKVEKPRG